ncbi:adenine-specific methyltransferase EcoRI family protein [Microbacterium hydrocarbonoxydans]|uniref:adenine-specific methyltransferase EcoRI family protein n=1 Tax=Microbacterium hydrocarbonoxydans TaxID=273678 RepID=UPI00203AD271|nr:adenine-specific methyltransferase EcoRI family protein [Microbacterium hydrocarbonoxydans]MCM3780621.1 adenine-specific methyltransferase EcoRI family protein [Microbacterium hydrocarbonoxydans]
MSTVANRTSSLTAAKAAKNDEFYTQWADIEREMNAYLEFDPDVFRDQVVLLPCDDPEWSNFAKFFALHFADFGLKKLISTSYAPDSNPALFSYEPTLFELDDPKFDATKTHANGKKFVLERTDLNDDGVINIDDLQWEYLEGDGDFRSAEVTALRDEADIVITNPPFSLFREFIAWLMEGDKRFSIIGNQNAVTYSQVFPLIKANQVWKGATANATDMVFGVPKGAVVKEADRAKAERMGYPSDEKNDYTRLGNSCWFTNIEHGRRHEPMQLMTMADNLKFNRKLIKSLGGSVSYQKYDNFDAIEVPHTDAIPSDFDGVMGVPITFLDKFNPDQFEIVDLSRYAKTRGMSKEFVDDYYASGQTGQISVGHPDLCYYDNAGRPVVPYMRVLIRKKGASP